MAILGEINLQNKQWLLAVTLLWSGTAFGSTAFGGDVEYGAYLSAECVTCHEAGAKTSEKIPSIEGWDEASFVAVMQSIRAKERSSEVMETIAASLDDEQIEALAAYFATLKPKE